MQNDETAALATAPPVADAEVRAICDRLMQRGVSRSTDGMLVNPAGAEAAALIRSLHARAVRAEAERDEARALLAEAKEALRPFSQKASAYDPAEDDDDDHAWSQLSTRRELRRARDVLARLEGAAGNPVTEQDQGDTP